MFTLNSSQDCHQFHSQPLVLNRKQNVESIMSKSNITEKASKLMRQSQGAERRSEAKERGLAGFHCPTSSQALFGGSGPESRFLGLSDFHSDASQWSRFTLGHRINFNCTEKHWLYLGIVVHLRLRGDVTDATRNDPNITYNMLSIFACFCIGEATQSHTSHSVKWFLPLESIIGPAKH